MLDLGEMPHEELYRMRASAAPEMQGMLAPFEHRAFAREFAQESPVKAALSLPFAVPAYSLAKALGLQKARTPATMDEVFAGYHGLAEGMLGNIVPSAYAHHEQSETVQRPGDGKWINVYGRRTPKAGQPLPGTGVYDSVEEAVAAARQRSENEPSVGRVNGRMIPRPDAGRTRHSGGGVRG
jgi:hypothetical protein